MVRSPHTRRLHFQTLEDRLELAADLQLLDVNVHPAELSSSPRAFVEVGETVYFTAFDHRGRELWKTDGTAAGTQLVKDINPGVREGIEYDAKLVNFGGVIYFRANDGASGVELWRSDGTEAGTYPVRDLWVGPTDSAPTDLVEFNGDLYFVADAGAGRRLWKSDGTSAGTTIVSPIAASAVYNIGDSLLVFSAGRIYKSDGTTAGTLRVSTTTFNTLPLQPRTSAVMNGALYFQAQSGSTGLELWRADTTSVSQVKDVNAGSASSSPAALTVVGDVLYFHATTAAQGRELWKTDGTSAGTQLVKDIALGINSSFANTTFADMVVYNGQLHFATQFGGPNTAPTAIWKTDGTDAGTMRVTVTTPIVSTTPIQNLTAFQGYLYFSATVSAPPPVRGLGNELWRTDGTDAGTTIVADANPGLGDSYPINLFVHNDVLLYGASNGPSGTELFRTDGTANGTALVKDIWQGTLGSDASRVFDANGTAYFMADDGIHGLELWKSDGTPAGTMLVADIAPGAANSIPQEMTVVGNTLYFVASSDGAGYELYKTDGTPGGTVALKEAPGTEGRNPFLLTCVGDKLFFFAYDAATGSEPWISDGTEAGTHMIEDVYPGDGSSFEIYTVADMNGIALFAARDPDDGLELWRSDGTPEGTYQVADLKPGPESTYPYEFTIIGDTAYFYVHEGWHGDQIATLGLWKTNGTAEGTARLGTIDEAQYWFITPPQLTNYNGVLHFVKPYTSILTRDAIWRVDASGTGIEVAAIVDSFGISDINALTVVNGQLLFHVGLGSGDIWVSDGTTEGTHMLRERTSRFANETDSFTVVGDFAYFVLHDYGMGLYSLWRTDGTASGTVEVVDLPDRSGLNQGPLVNVNGVLALVMDDTTHGRELWLIRPVEDYTGDAAVDGADFLAWQQQLGSLASPVGSGSDGDGNGIVDSGDLAVWRERFVAGFGAEELAELAVTEAALTESSSASARFAFDAAALMGPLAYALEATLVGPAIPRHVDSVEISVESLVFDTLLVVAADEKTGESCGLSCAPLDTPGGLELDDFSNDLDEAFSTLALFSER
jgi:ELWxxDGT repeat protein